MSASSTPRDRGASTPSPTVRAPEPVSPGGASNHRCAAGAHGSRNASSSHRADHRTAGRTSGSAHCADRPTTVHRSSAKRRRGRGPVIALVTILVILGLVYAAGIAAFTFVFYPNTSITGIDVSLLTAEAAQDRLDSATNDYTLSVTGDGFSWDYQPAGSRNIFDTGAAVRRRLNQNEAFLWPFRLYESLTSSDAAPAGEDGTASELSYDPDLSLLGASFDRTAFETGLQQAVDTANAGRSGAFDAQSSYDEAAGAFTPERALANRKLDADKVIRLALNALANLEETADLSVLGDDAYLPLDGAPSAERIQQACDAANAFLGTNVTFKLGDATAGSLDGATLRPWISFDAVNGPALDTAAVGAWASELAQGMDTVGTTRTYTRPDGKQVTIGGGTYGWKVDEDALVQAVQDAAANHQTGDVAVPTAQEGATYVGPGQPDWGAYADVDLTEQRARYYDASGNLLWETGVVTGKPDGENDTPTGIYYVNNKLRNITLVGKKDPATGKPSYESPVEYWIAFVGGAIGFHDASWQNPSVYDDPTAYQRVGSHGCINTPLDKVIELYDLIQIGDAVIVHP